MKVLVIGGTGTIGLGIVKECIKKGYDTFTISRGLHNSRLPKECKIILGDIKKEAEIKETLADYNFDVIFDGLVFRLPNLKSSIELYRNKCKHYIFVSTTGIYSRQEKSSIKENYSKGRIQWEYNEGKINCEKYLLANKDNLPFNFTIVRPSVTYGDRRIPYTIVDRKRQWSLIERIQNNKPIVGCNNVLFSICHLDDFSRGVVGLFMNEKAYGEAFHIGGPKAVRWDDVISEIEKIMNKKANIIHIDCEILKIYYPEMYYEIKYNKSDEMILDNKKIENTVEHFCPKVSLAEGIKRTYNTLQKEQSETPEDTYWNDILDLLIYVSLLKNKIKKSEIEIATKYIDMCDKEKLKEMAKKKRIKYPLLNCKNKVKRLLHKII